MLPIRKFNVVTLSLMALTIFGKIYYFIATLQLTTKLKFRQATLIRPE